MRSHKHLLNHRLVQNALKESEFRVGAQATDEEVKILVHGIVGDEWTGLDSLSVSEFLHSNSGKSVTVDINSVGGSAYDGLAIFNALEQHDGPTTGIVTGEAASAASIILQGVKHRVMLSNTMQMVHKSNVITWGNADDMRDVASILDICDECLLESYVAATGQPQDVVLSLMRGEGKMDGTYMTAKTAFDFGFCDEVRSIKQKAESPKNQTEQHLRDERNRSKLVATRARSVMVRQQMATMAEN